MLDGRCPPTVALGIAQAVHAGEAAVPPWERDGGGGGRGGTASAGRTAQQQQQPSIPGLLLPASCHGRSGSTAVAAVGSGRSASQRQADVCRRAALSRRLWESLAPTLANEGLLNALHTASGGGSVDG